MKSLRNKIYILLALLSFISISLAMDLDEEVIERENLPYYSNSDEEKSKDIGESPSKKSKLYNSRNMAKFSSSQDTDEIEINTNSAFLCGKGLAHHARCLWLPGESLSLNIQELINYDLKETPRSLFNKVNPILKYFNQLLIAELHLIVGYKNETEEMKYGWLVHNFKNNEGKELLFLSGSKGQLDQHTKKLPQVKSFSAVDYNSLQSLINIEEKKIFKWFIEIYWDFKNARKNLENSFSKGNNQGHGRMCHHAEQWLGIYLWYKTLPIITECLSEYSEIKKLYGLIVPFYSFNDVCVYCQEMWASLMNRLPKKLKKHLTGHSNITVVENFFFLPIASSSQYYSMSGRPSPVSPFMRNALNKLNINLNVNSSRNLSTKQLNFLQYSSEYKNDFYDKMKYFSDNFKNIEDFYSKKMFPCLWIPEEENIKISLAQKIHNLDKKKLRALFVTKEGTPLVAHEWAIDDIISYLHQTSSFRLSHKLRQLIRLDLSLSNSSTKLNIDEINLILNNLFPSFPDLKILEIEDIDAIAPLMENKQASTTLENLELKINDELTNNDIKSISASFPNLKHLSLFSGSIADEEGFDEVEEYIQDSGLAFLAKSLTRLESLSFQAYMITDSAIKSIGKWLTNLQTLNLSIYYCTNKSLKYLSKLPLEHLSFYQMKDGWDWEDTQGNIDNNGAVYISSLSSLRSLKLVNFKIGDQGLQQFLTMLPLLTELDVSRNNIGDKGGKAAIEFLRLHTSFTNLDISENPISHSIKRELLKFPQTENTDLRFIESDSEEEEEEEE